MANKVREVHCVQHTMGPGPSDAALPNGRRKIRVCPLIWASLHGEWPHSFEGWRRLPIFALSRSVILCFEVASSAMALVMYAARLFPSLRETLPVSESLLSLSLSLSHWMNAQQKARGRRVVEGLQVDVHVNDHHRGGVEMYMHPVSRCLHYYKFKTKDIFLVVPVETLLPRAE